MTQTLKKPDIEAQDVNEYYTKYFKDTEALRLVVLDYLFRNIGFVTSKEKIRAITDSEYIQISKALNVPRVLVYRFITRFLVNLVRIRKFFKQNANLLTSKHQGIKVRIYLHKFHRLAPVFDYRRARENARRLQLKLDHLCFRPQIMTQVAVVVFVTDLLDDCSSRSECKIIQSNLRVLCSCSAYAFHRTRNKIGLTVNYKKDLIFKNLILNKINECEKNGRTS